MTAGALLAAIESHGVKLWADGDRIRFRGTLTDDERAALRESKAAVLRLLTEGGPGEPSPSSRVSADDWAAMRALAPLVGRRVVVDGREGVLWGLTPHGAIFDTGTVLLTVGYGEVSTP